MRFESKYVVYGVYLLVFAMCVLVSAAVNLQGRRAVGAAAELADRDMPLLQTLGALKLDVVALEPIVYQYYTARDRARFERQLEANTERIEDGLKIIRAAFPHHILVAEIEAQYGPIQARVRELDLLLRGGSGSNQTARTLLGNISGLCSQINANVDQLEQSVHSTVSARVDETKRRIVGITTTVALFSILLFAVIFVAGLYARAYLAASAARRRLSMFPERDPNPVLRLTRDGRIQYGNPGARETLTRLGADPSNPLQLLPPDLPQRLAALLASGNGYEWWEYSALGRSLGCGIHFLEDYGVFHAYLSDLTERKRAEEQLVYQAYHDALTELPNRRLFLERLSALLQSAPEQTAGIMLLQVDRFKDVIESLGHAAGDALLRQVADRIAATIGEDRADGAAGLDVGLYRFEGERFAVLVSGALSTDGVMRLASRLGVAMAESIQVGERALFSSLSIGVSLYPNDGREAETLVRNAESALHRALQEGGGAFRCYAQEMNARALQRLELENDLRVALARGELDLYYEPQVDIATGRVVGAEALLRWRHPVRGMIAPVEFIPLAEATGLIVSLGEWVLRRACAQNRLWRDAGNPDLTVAVNLSARQFQSGDIVQSVRRVLCETGLPAAALELEVTESVAMHEVERAIATLRGLKELGVKLAIDDFGTGYSSLSYLKRFPLDKLKVDQSFVRNLTADAADASIVRAITALGHSLKLKVIAEGVENAGQRDTLARLGCDEMQGYLVSRALPAQEFSVLLAGKPVLARG